jgi:PAS domain S-box-containing protein
LPPFIYDIAMKLSELRLSTRITISTLIIVAAGAATLAYVENERIREAYISDMRAHLKSDLETERLRLNQAVETVRQDVLFLSNAPPVSGIVRAALNHGYDPHYGNTHKVWAERLEQIFSAFSQAHPNYFKIRYIGAADAGREIVSVNNRRGKIEAIPSDKLQSKEDRDYFKATLRLKKGQVYLSEFDVTEEWGVIDRPIRPTLRASTPVFTPSGEIFGMVVISLDVSSLLNFAERNLPPGTHAYIADATGHYLLHPDSQKTISSGMESSNGITRDFPFAETMFNLRTPDYLPLQTVATSFGNALICAMRIHFDPGDQARFLLLLHAIPEAVTEGQIATIPIQHIGGGFFGMLLVSGIALSLLRRTFAPLEKLTEAANNIAAGKHDVQLPQNGTGEIGSLAKSLNTMLTQLLHRELSLLESEARYRRLYESMMDAFNMTDMSGRLLEFNYAFREMLGYSASELLGMTCNDLTPLKWHEYEAQIINEQVILLGYSRVYEKEYVRKDGTVFPVEIKTFLLRGENNQPQAMCAIVRDVTERKRTKEQLRKSSEEISDLYNRAPCGYHSLDKDGNIRMMNDTELSWLGYTRDEVIGKIKWTDLLSPGSLVAFQKSFQQLMQRGFVSDIESELIRKDGTTFTGLVNASAIYDPTGNFVMSRSTVVDITERNRAARHLQELSAHLQTIRENEKNRIAREIHDDLGGTLTALKMDVFWLARKLPADKTDDIVLKRVNSMSQLLDNAVGVTRRIITDLRPTILDDLGLLAALEWQAEQFQKRTGISCRVNCVEDDGALDKQYSIALFRIFQETLTNVARHSGASRVEVEFHCDGEEAMLSISDNGCGLPKGHTAAPTSFGMRGMSERAEQLGGSIKFESPPQGGLRVTVILPLPDKDMKEETS